MNNLLPPFIFLIGAAIGSFLNVVALRAVEGKPITGRSVCPHCGAKLTWWQLIPLLSFMYLGARCATCRRPVSVLYPCTELIVGIIFLILFIPLPGQPLEILTTIGQAVLACLLLVVSIIDLKSFLLPDRYIVAMTVVAIFLYLVAGQLTFVSLLTGVGLGVGLLLLIWFITSGKGIGLGDVKLMVPLGIMFGLPGVAVILWLAFVSGGVVGVWMVIRQRATMKTAIPFGPFLAASAIVLLLLPELPEKLYQLLIN